MTDLPAAQANAMLAAAYVPSTTYYLGLNVGDPGTTGANEVTGGSYVRQAITFGSPASGSQASTNSQTFTGLAGPPTVTNFSIWTASSGGTYLGGGALAFTVGQNIVVFGTGAITFTVA